jgi:ribosomal protein S27E
MSNEGAKDPPLVASDDVRVATIIDLAGVRVRMGFPAPKAKICEHKTLIYSVHERLVWCEDCEQLIDAFSALMTIVRQFDAMVSAARSANRKANEALGAVARLRAVKTLDRVWSGNTMAVQCPHCKGGLLPEDFANGASASWARELEIKDRLRKKAKKDE